MIEKLAIIAIGGNSLIEDPKDPAVVRQWDAARKTCRHIADMIVAGWHVVVTHGNGPQVGYILRRGEIAAKEGIHDVPLDLIVADTQGSIGYMLQQGLDNSLRRLGINRSTLYYRLRKHGLEHLLPTKVTGADDPLPPSPTTEPAG